jgi:hypothetical protein
VLSGTDQVSAQDFEVFVLVGALRVRGIVGVERGGGSGSGRSEARRATSEASSQGLRQR